jgi:hypothetical protein
LSGAIFLPRPPWTLDTPGMVLDPNDVADDADDEPPQAKAAGLYYTLGIRDTCGVRENLEQQRGGASRDLELFLRAFDHYVRRDAFLEL